MMKSWIMVFLILISGATFTYADISVCADGGGEVTSFNLRGDRVPGCVIYSLPGRTQAEYDAARTLLKTQPQRYLKILNGSLVEKAPSEKVAADDALAASIQAALLSDSRAGAKASVDELSREGVRLRAALLVTLDRVNTITAAYDAIISCNVNNSTAANIRACINAIPPVGQAVALQMKNQIKGKIDAGSAD